MSAFPLEAFMTVGLPFEEDLQCVLELYQEFAILKDAPIKGVVGSTGYYRHQLIIHYLMIDPNFRTLLTIARPGTGKTHTFLGAALFYYRLYQQLAGDVVNKPTIVRSLILTSGTAQRDDILGMIVNGPDGDIFRGENHRQTKRLISQWFEVTTYRKWASKVILGALELAEEAKRPPTVSDLLLFLRRHYARTICYFDEIHNFNIDEPNLRQILDSLLTDASFLADPKVLGDEEDDHPRRLKIPVKRTIIRLLILLTSYTPLVKVLASSATPMQNNPNDMKTAAAIIITDERRRQEFISIDLRQISETQLHSYLKNLISYVAASVTSSVRDYQGQRVEVVVGQRTYAVPLVLVGMSPHQQQMYRAEVPRSVDTAPTRDVYNKAKSVSLFADFDKLVEWDNQRHRFVFTSFTNKLFDVSTPDKHKKALENLKTYSCVYYQVISIISDPRYYTDEQRTQPLGVIGIYVEYVDRGIILLGLIIERFLGLELFNDNRSDIWHNTEDGLELAMPEAKRVAILHTRLGAKTLRNAKEILASKANYRGQYINVVLISGESSEGVTVEAAVAVIICGAPRWGPAAGEQAEGRFLREEASETFKRYISRDSNFRARFLDEEGALKIRIYRIVACPVDRDGRPLLADSVHVSIYGLIQEKQQYISHMLRMLKRIAVDCVLNRGRNQLPSRFQGQVECDYDTCDYGCYSCERASTGELIMNNYNSSFYQDHATELSTQINDILELAGTMEMSDLLMILSRTTGKAASVISSLMTFRTLLRHHETDYGRFALARFYHIRGSCAVLSGAATTNSQYNNLLMGRFPARAQAQQQIISRQRSQALSLFNQRELIESAAARGDSPFEDNDEFLSKLREIISLPNTVRSTILEAALDEYQSNLERGEASDAIIMGILFIFRYHWTRCRYPLNVIEYYRKNAIVKRKRGRPPKGGVAARAFTINDASDSERKLFDFKSGVDSDPCYIHDLSIWSSKSPLSNYFKADKSLTFCVIKHAPDDNAGQAREWITITPDISPVVFKAISFAFVSTCIDRFFERRPKPATKASTAASYYILLRHGGESYSFFGMNFPNNASTRTHTSQGGYYSSIHLNGNWSSQVPSEPVGDISILKSLSDDGFASIYKSYKAGHGELDEQTFRRALKDIGEKRDPYAWSLFGELMDGPLHNAHLIVQF